MKTESRFFEEWCGKSGRLSVDELVLRARSFQKQLSELSGITEANRRVAAETMSNLASAGLLNFMRAERHGGFAHGPSMLIRVGYELGQGCGSTAWCTNIANCNSWLASYWSEQAQQDIWDDPNNRISGLLAPTGKCEIAEGGYNVWGSWPFGSNCDNSEWTFVSAPLPSVGDEPSSTGWFLLPIDALNIDHNTWFVSGMQGTGSKTLYTDEPIFVPAHRVIRYDDIIQRKVPGCSIEGNTPANFAFSTFGACALVGPILGMSKGALDWFVSSMREKIRINMKPGTKSSATQNPFLQERVGRAAVMIDSALTYVLAEVESAERKIMVGEELSISDRVRVRNALIHSAREAVDAVDLFMELAGASGGDSQLPLQRFWRDINSGARHVSLDARGVYAMAGQAILGLNPIGVY
ncbi:hypothetical protein F2A38_12495 [Pseudomonas chlororaphis]|uniref:Acyl-CoA dehydrogenase C-terminal domain-containing protein n=1 Tax=Pseudomonas chlororaphis TaxID=587753 RepID=A0AB34C6V1_9PSED|nr:acyl-CoA dehydrogenase family protein [Pseudomonas chlororaphis]KAA5842476.1 hypothetical protein F2A38_12495 [Pseudomonas chlororaphis]